MNTGMDNMASRLAEEAGELQVILNTIDEKMNMMSRLWEGEAADLARGRYNRIKSELDAAAAKLVTLSDTAEEKHQEDREPDGDRVLMSDFLL